MRKAQFSMELPEVLTSEEEKRVLERLPDFEAQNILVERNLRLVRYISQSYVNNYIVRAEILEDLFSVGTLGLIKASRTYSLERNAAFPTYATKCIQNEIGMYLKKDRRRENVEMHLEDVLATDDDDNKLSLIDMLSDRDISIQNEEVELISNLLTAIINRYSRQERAIFYYTMSGKNQSEIGKLLSISQSYVSRVQKRVFLKNSSLLANKPAYLTRISVDYLGDEIILATFQKQYFTEEFNLFLKNNQDKYHYLLKSYKDRIKVSGFMQDIFYFLAELSRLALI